MKTNRLVKDDIVSEVCRATRLSRIVVKMVIDATLDSIINSMASGKDVQFAGFGIFELKKRAARTGRNPHTNEPVPIPERVVPAFKAGKDLKEAVIK